MPHSYTEAIQTDTSIYANLQDLSFGIEFGIKCHGVGFQQTDPAPEKKQELLASSRTISNPSLQALNDSEAGWDIPCIVLILNPGQSSSFDI